MNKGQDKRIRVHVLFPPSIIEQLDELAEGEGSPRAAVIRGFVRDGLDRVRLSSRDIERRAA